MELNESEKTLVKAARSARSVYVHVPFCSQRCGYCHFSLVTGRDYLIERYLAALEIELEAFVDSTELREIDTLFFGGGTPTYFSPRQLEQLFELVRQFFSLAAGAEISVEANPNDLSCCETGLQKVLVLRSFGVNRVSLGAQSFQNAKLKFLERTHRAEDVSLAVERVREFTNNISLDLIFGVAGETTRDWKRDLESAVELPLTHVSTYSLTIEKGTTFFNRHLHQTSMSVDSDQSADLYELAIDELTRSGWKHYETSNFCQPGFECRHNESYWMHRPYLSFGPGAASFSGRFRWSNHASVSTYIKRLVDQKSAIAQIDQLDEQELARERLIFGLRKIDGISLSEFQTAVGQSVRELIGPEKLDSLVDGGLLSWSDNRLALTRRGLLVSDSIWVELI